ncbi:MAG: RapZ C-terminal domain-containing protein [Candidatus Dormibacteria bacterium]
MSGLIIVLGAPGSGRSLALTALGDAGYRVRDDVHPDRLDTLPDEAVAIAVLPGVGDVSESLRRLDASGRRYQLLFLDGPAGSPEPALRLAEARERAHHHLPWTSDPGERRRRVLGLGRRFLPRERPLLALTTFAYKKGLPQEADWVVDVRFAPNPYWDDRLRERDGNDPEVSAYVLAGDGVEELVLGLASLMVRILPVAHAQGRQALEVAIGCTGGRHRSVAVALRLASLVGAHGLDVTVQHRDLT